MQREPTQEELIKRLAAENKAFQRGVARAIVFAERLHSEGRLSSQQNSRKAA